MKRLLALASIALVSALVLAGFRTRSPGLPNPPTAFNISEAAEPHPPWYPEYREDISWVLSERVALRPFEVYRLLDVETRHVNIRNGDRVTFDHTPHHGDHSTVWIYGGSAAFGLEQRDEHTVASNLVRIAAEDGIHLEVLNRGTPGQLHWRSALRFGWDLAVEEPPDLVLFYEGAEELAASRQLIERNLGDVRAPYESFLENTYDEVQGVSQAHPAPPPGVLFNGWPTVEGKSPIDSTGGLAARRWLRSLDISASLADHYEVPAVYVWQPNRPDPNELAEFAEASAALPPYVFDFSRILDDAEGVAFSDSHHHGEHGSMIVARELFSVVSGYLDGGAGQ